MKTNKAIRVILILFIVMMNIGCDQVSKNIVRQRIAYDESIALIGNHFTLTKIENAGAFLSLGDSLPYLVKLTLLSVFPLLVLAAGLAFILYKTNMEKIPLAGICFIIGGGIGNIYDRIVYGSVTDFMHIDFVLFQTGIFNMADVSVMVGTFLLFFHSYINRKNASFIHK